MSVNKAYVQYMRKGMWCCVIIIEQSHSYVQHIKLWQYFIYKICTLWEEIIGEYQGGLWAG